MPQLTLFGGATLEDESGAVPELTARHHPMALLALLAVEPSCSLTRDKLLGYLWPHAPADRARPRLNTCVHRIRSVLGNDRLVSAGDDLRLETGALTCDVWQFRQAMADGDHERAVELYQGPLLDGFHLKDSPAFEKWVDRKRGRLRREYCRALESLAETAEDRGEARAAARWWRERADEDPYDSRVARRLMHALVEAGNRVEALGVAGDHEELLREELGTSPDESVRDLAHRLRAEKPADDDTLTAPEPEEERPPPRERRQASQPQTAGSPETAPARRRTWRQHPLVGLAALTVAAGIAATGWILVRDGAPGDSPLSERTIAVLPFASLGETDGQDFAAGMHAGVLTRLAGISGLRVVSGTSVRQYRQAEEPLPEIARELGAGWVLEGEVHRVGERVRVNAQLVDARTDTHLWAESYARELTARDLFEIQEELTRRIVEALEVELSPEEKRQVASVPTENTAAYELYLQARRLRSEIPGLGAVGRNERRIRLLQRSLALDSTFAEAWAGLAASYKARAWREWSPVWADSARRAARRALDLNRELADAYSYLGDAYWVLGDRDAQLEAYRTALSLQPGHPHTANNLVTFLGFWGRLAEKAKWLDTLLHTSPRSGWVVGNLVSLNSTLGREVVADAWRDYARSHGISTRHVDFHLRLRRGQLKGARKLFAIIEGSETNETHLSRRRAALALYEGSWTRARKIYRELYGGAAPGASHSVFQSLLDDRLGLAWSLRELGQMKEAREIAVRVRKNAADEVRRTERGYPSHLRLAVSHLILGDTARALDWLGSAVDAGYRGRETLDTVPTLAPLQDHPRFRALLARVDSLVAEERRRVEAEGWAEPD